MINYNQVNVHTAQSKKVEFLLVHLLQYKLPCQLIGEAYSGKSYHLQRLYDLLQSSTLFFKDRLIPSALRKNMILFDSKL